MALIKILNDEFCEPEDCSYIENKFRALRKAWFNKVLRSHAHEREWEDEEQHELREKQNNDSLELYNKQTEEIINGKHRCIAPYCMADFYE